MAKALVRLVGITLCLSLGLHVAAAAAPGPAIRLTGRIFPPVPADLQIELAPLVFNYAEASRQLAGETVPPIAATQPRPDGTYELRAPESGLYRVRVRAPGRVPVEILLIPVLEDREIPPVALEPAVPVEITVLGPDGLPAQGLRLRALAAEAFRAGPRPLWRPSQSDSVTDKDGKVTVPQGGELSLVALAPGVPDRFIETVSGPRHTLRLTRREPQILEVRGRNGKPRAGVLVRWGFTPYGVTGADGRMPLPASANGATLRLEDADGPAAEVEIPAAAKEPAQPPSKLTIQLPTGRAVAGRVLDAASRAPLAGAVLWSDWHHSERTDAQGRFQIRVFGDSEAAIPVVAVAHLGATIEASLPGENRPVTVALPPSTALDGIVMDGAGQAIAEAEIQAQANLGGQGPQGGTVRSAADGRFRLAGLALGRTYEIAATKTGFAPFTTSWDMEPGKATPLHIVLRKGSTATGRVVDAAGKAVAGAELSLQPFSELWGRRVAYRLRVALTSTSDAEGRFRFSDLEAGLFSLSAAHVGFAVQTVQGIEIPAEPRALELGEVTLERAVVLEGRVTDRRGAAIAEAEITIFCPDSSLAPWPSRRRSPPQTDTEGRFRIEDLARGSRCDLRVRKAGFVSARLPGVEVPTREPLRIALALSGTLAGRVVGPQGEPVPGVQISQAETSETWNGARVVALSSSVRDIGQTDKDGRFQLTELPASTIDLFFSGQGYKRRLLRGVEIGEGGGDPLEVVLEKGELLEGRILTSRGEPVTGARVNASFLVAADPSFVDLLPVVTDGDGVYRLEGLETGRYDLSAESPDREEMVSASVDVRPGANRLDLTFRGGVEVDGLVVDPAGAPVPGVTVSLMAFPQGRTYQAESRADGSFRLRTVEDGDYHLAAQADGFAAIVQKDLMVHVAGQAIHGLELRLERGTLLTGRLLGFTPDELRLVRVQAFLQPDPAPHNRGAFSYRNGAVQDGSYRIPTLAAGVWQVMAVAGSRTVQGSITIEFGAEQATLDLQAPAGFTLSGRVMIDGAPLSAATVSLEGQTAIGAGPLSYGQDRTAWDGSFKIPGLNAGGYLLMIGGPAEMIDHRQVELAGDQTLAIEITTGSVNGQVLSVTGEPVAGALVALTGEDLAKSFNFQMRTARSGEQGTFELLRIAAGSYRITARKEGFAPTESSVTVTPGGTVQTVIVLKEMKGASGS